MVGIVKFCEREDLILLADEVYQENTYLVPPANPNPNPNAL